ncbi:MAG: glutamate--tRNA ligase [Pseudomonadota bacterium]|nr:glutamate--tRNA ligase [Pseudomonadota bacterium]
MPSKVVTRFAPSPTGFLHIGGARTALFNWLYARHHGGTMLLRIEDTDRERSTSTAVDAILDGLSWLGVDWEGDPVSQYSRAARHREIAEQLVAEGNAYYCFATQEELAEMREKARAEGRPPRYDGRWRDRDPAEAPAGARGVIRLKAPLDGETVVDDQVQGRVVFPNKDLDDLVLLRSDGSPTYMLAVVVDDHDMGVTHIIRGDDHLTNAGRQTLIFKALGWDVPVMGHVPLIHGPDGAKLSKRHGALGAEAYRAMGYLPEALRNYLVRLGWAHGDDDIISTEQMIEWFGFEGLGRSPARFDIAKLQAINGHYIRHADDDYLVTRMLDVLPDVEHGEEMAKALDSDKYHQLVAAMPGLKERAKTVLELVDGAGFLFAKRPLELDEKARTVLDADARKMLAELIDKLRELPSWTSESTEQAVRAFADAREIKLGKVAQPLRAALTGRTVSPPVFDVLAVLGSAESLDRLADQVADI